MTTISIHGRQNTVKPEPEISNNETSGDHSYRQNRGCNDERESGGEREMDLGFRNSHRKKPTAAPPLAGEDEESDENRTAVNPTHGPTPKETTKIRCNGSVFFICLYIYIHICNIY